MASRLSNKRGVIVDLDGTLYRGEIAVPGAVSWFHRIRQTAGVICVTNNSKSPPDDVAARLRRMGFDVRDDQVLTSASAAASYVAQVWKDSPVLVLGEEGLWQAVSAAGIRGFRPGDIDPERVSAVLQGIHQGCTYGDLAELCLAIRAGAAYVLTNPDRALPGERGLVPGAGAISALIESATGVAPLVIGKPQGRMMEEALRLLGLPREDVVVVGDNLETDVAAGHRVGLDTVLVLTGYSRREDLASSALRPTWVLDDLGQWFA
ncbi:MAG: HAD-IIA family hydrolase [Kyrpidia sp.]|nr:HAD-IIA family hydrolase [Kyrpidia sp.]